LARSEPARRLAAVVAALRAVPAVLPFQAVRIFLVAPVAVLPARAAALLASVRSARRTRTFLVAPVAVLPGRAAAWLASVRSVRRKSRVPPGLFDPRICRVLHWFERWAPPEADAWSARLFAPE
jgi:hypothetical protein